MADPPERAPDLLPHKPCCAGHPADHPAEESQVRITRTAPAPDVLVLATDGEIDFTTLAPWRDALAAAIDRPRVRLLICDCTDLGFLSIGGFLALIDAHRAARRRGIRMTVRNPPATLVRLLTVVQNASVPFADAELIAAAAELAAACDPPVHPRSPPRSP